MDFHSAAFHILQRTIKSVIARKRSTRTDAALSRQSVRIDRDVFSYYAMHHIPVIARFMRAICACRCGTPAGAQCAPLPYLSVGAAIGRPRIFDAVPIPATDGLHPQGVGRIRKAAEPPTAAHPRLLSEPRNDKNWRHRQKESRYLRNAECLLCSMYQSLISPAFFRESFVTAGPISS